MHFFLKYFYEIGATFIIRFRFHSSHFNFVRFQRLQIFIIKFEDARGMNYMEME